MSTTVSQESLEAAIQRVGNPVDLLRNSTYPAVEFPIKPEFTNWRSEQAAWRESCALLDQSHHMSDLFITGPDSFQLLAGHGVNTFETFAPGKAKQYVAANQEGYYVGDGILFYLDDESFDLVANPSVVNWIQFQAESGGYDVSIERDDNSNRRIGPPRLYRYELQGPTAASLVEKLINAPLPEVKFFNMTDFTIAGRRVRALRHGMAGQPGFELFGPWQEGEDVLEAILAVGGEFGLVRAGAKAYATANLESGWIPRPPSAVFGEGERAYREWLPATSIGSLGGSMDSREIRDYYVTPYDIGYGHVVKFDHDFLGREALEEVAKNPHRTKVTLVWNVDDVLSIMRSQFDSDVPAKWIEWPKARYAYFHCDKILHSGEWAGISTDVGYIANERVMVSLATIDRPLSEEGTEVIVLWGEDPNSGKPAVEPHRQVEVRATVAPVPYARPIREAYRR
jgi:glycine cleavage system aminomethyltransferase T